MKKLPKLMIVLSVALFFLWGSAVSAFELQYEKAGKAYYKADDGTEIVHEIDKEALTPQFLYNDKENRVMYFRASDGRIVEARRQGGNLSNTPDYDWWYGCSPTSAGMMMGYYDINGYGGLVYPNLVPGSTAELNTYPAGTYIANDTIASSQHIADYWVAYTNIGDDPCNGNLTTCHGGGNCLADFMGTSQDMTWLFPACDGVTTNPVNSDGSSLVWTYTDGTTMTWEAMGGLTNCYWETCLMYGIGEYVQYAGYNHVTGSLYNRRIDEQATGTGFTYNDFKAEIDAGRPVMIQLEGHSMFGYGYLSTNTVYVYDTWSSGGGTMTWNGTYGAMQHFAVTCFTPTSGTTPTQVSIVPMLMPLVLD